MSPSIAWVRIGVMCSAALALQHATAAPASNARQAPRVMSQRAPMASTNQRGMTGRPIANRPQGLPPLARLPLARPTSSRSPRCSGSRTGVVCARPFYRPPPPLYRVQFVPTFMPRPVEAPVRSSADLLDMEQQDAAARAVTGRQDVADAPAAGSQSASASQPAAADFDSLVFISEK